MAIIKPFTFRAGEKARAAEVNQDFDILYQEVNNQSSNMQSIEDDITSLENSKANINGSSSQRFAVADAVSSYDAINRHTLEAIYPIGAIYIGTTEECPISKLFGTWEKISDGRVLQSSDENHEAGTTIAAGLPNITGGIYFNGTIARYPEDGSLYGDGSNLSCWSDRNVSDRSGNPKLDASRSSSIYGQSETVQPPAYVVNIWERVS